MAATAIPTASPASVTKRYPFAAIPATANAALTKTNVPTKSVATWVLAPLNTYINVRTMFVKQTSQNKHYVWKVAAITSATTTVRTARKAVK